MDDFEQFLRRQPLRKIPAHWREEILATEPPREIREDQHKPWWLAWLWPSPVAWAGVACAWVLIIGLNVASRPGMPAMLQRVQVSPQEFAAILAERRRLVQELSPPPGDATPPIRRRGGPGACRRPERMETIAV